MTLPAPAKSAGGGRTMVAIERSVVWFLHRQTSVSSVQFFDLQADLILIHGFEHRDGEPGLAVEESGLQEVHVEKQHKRPRRQLV